MKVEIDQKVTHKTLGEGVVTDVYDRENGNMYFDVHFATDDADEWYGKYKVSSFRLDDADKWFENSAS